MSNFLDVIRARIDGCYIKGLESCLPVHSVDDHNLKIDKIIDKLDSLGENARRMLEIGIVQDRLVELGFSSCVGVSNDSMGRFIYVTDKDNEPAVFVIFYLYYYTIQDSGENYNNSPTWQDDLINRVKELINETN